MGEKKGDYALHNLDPQQGAKIVKIHRDLLAHEGRWDFVDRCVAGEYRPVALKYSQLFQFFGKNLNAAVV